MADLPAPYLDPSLLSGYLDAQRKQQMAQALAQSFQQANQTPPDWDSMRVVPKRGAIQNISALASALLSAKAQGDATAATRNYMAALYGGAQPTGQPATNAAPGASQADSGQTFNGPTGASINTPGLLPPTQTPVPTSAAAPRGNPLVPPTMTPQQAQQIALAPGGMEALTKSAVERAQLAATPLEIQRSLAAAGIDPNSPRGQALQQQILQKGATIPPELIRQGETALDAVTHVPYFTGPQNNIDVQWQNGRPVASVIPGSAAAERTLAGAKTAGVQQATPIKLGTDENGRDIYGYPAAPGAPGTTNATAPASTASPATVESQKAGAKAGQDYASEIAKNAAGATEVRRSISELKNLASQSSPNASNDAKSRLGAYMIAAGADPSKVSKWLGVDVGALQAAQKQTATLAVNAIHSMTSRGTNFDLDMFMRNNPNVNMADPQAFARVADYMNNKAAQDIAKQKDFAQWKKQPENAAHPEDWETDHTAHWLDLQNRDIDAGRSNSAAPPIAAPASAPSAPKIAAPPPLPTKALPSTAALEAEIKRRQLQVTP